MLTIVKL